MVIRATAGLWSTSVADQRGVQVDRYGPHRGSIPKAAILRGGFVRAESRTRYSAADLSESESRTRYSAADLSESESPLRRSGSAKWECMPWRQFVVILCIWNVIWSACFGLFLERRSKPIGVISADCDRLPIDRCISSDDPDSCDFFCWILLI